MTTTNYYYDYYYDDDYYHNYDYETVRQGKAGGDHFCLIAGTCFGTKTLGGDHCNITSFACNS